GRKIEPHVRPPSMAKTKRGAGNRTPLFGIRLAGGLPCRGAGLRQASTPTGLFCGRSREDRYVDFGVGAGFERDGAVGEGIERVIDAHADTAARMPLGPALPDEDVAGEHGFAAEFLDAEAPASRIATVAGRTACL